MSAAGPSNRRGTRAHVRALVRLALALTVAAVALQAAPAQARASAAQPRNVSAVKVTHTSATAVWTTARAAGSFRVSVARNPRFRGARVVEVRTPRVVLGGLAPRTRYYLKVRALNRPHGRATGRAVRVRGGSFVTRSAPRVVTATRPPAPSTALSWTSGVATAGRIGDFAAWRSRPVGVLGTWNDDYEAQRNQWTLWPEFSAGNWNGDLDNAVGGIFKSRGDTWAAAAQGAYDERWRTALRRVAGLRQGLSGTVYLRFAHEFNGDWYPWSVTPGEVTAFKQAWRRFRAVQLAELPAAKLVFCPNADSSGAFGGDWRTAFPGREYVDVVSVDYYNQWPFIRTDAEFASTALSWDRWGGPRGLERHRQFAQAQGLPFAISEWSSNGSMGDSPAFVRSFYAWLRAHGGQGAGRVLYEVHFNVSGYDDNYQFFPVRKQPLASQTYRSLWAVP